MHRGTFNGPGLASVILAAVEIGGWRHRFVGGILLSGSGDRTISDYRGHGRHAPRLLHNNYMTNYS